MSGLILALLQRFKFPGPIYPVNPKYETLQGLPCYASVEAIPAGEAIDLAIIYLPAEAAVQAAAACGARGARGLVLLSAGFAEVG